LADIFREIDEELQQDRASKLWQRYGGWLIAVAVGVVLTVAGNVFLTRYNAQLQSDRGDRYEAAAELAAEGDPRRAAEAFASLADDAGGGYATLARLRAAAAFAAAGDVDAAVATFDAVAATASAPYADLAMLRSVRLRIGREDPAALLNALAHVLAAGNPWRPLAVETEAAIQLQAGDTDRALALYKSLSDDVSTPSQLRARAAEMVRALGG